MTDPSTLTGKVEQAIRHLAEGKITLLPDAAKTKPWYDFMRVAIQAKRRLVGRKDESISALK
jgi:hypothetical protein